MELPVATAAQLEAEQRFELQLTEDARRQFVNSLVKKTVHKDGTITYNGKNLSEITPGMRAVTEMMGDGKTFGILKAFREFRSECLNILNDADGRGRVSLCRLVAAERTPEELAFITANTLLTIPNDRMVKGAAHLTMASKVAKVIKSSMELSEWVTECRRLAKEEGVKDPSKFMLASVRGDVTMKVWSRWKRKIVGIGMDQWTPQMRYQIATPLIHLAVENSGGYFGMENTYIHGKTKKLIKLTPEGVEKIQGHIEDSLLSASMLRPMICPPIAWRKSNV